MEARGGRGVQLAEVGRVVVQDGRDGRALRAGEGGVQLMEGPSQVARVFPDLRDDGVCGGRERVLSPPEVGGRLLRVLVEPAGDVLAVLGALVQELVSAALVLLQQLDEISDARGRGCGFAVLVQAPELDHVAEEDFEVVEGVAEVDGVVDGADHGLIGGDETADGLGNVVGRSVAEDADDLLPVTDAEVDGEIFESESMLRLG